MQHKGINYDVGVRFNEQYISRPSFDIKTVAQELQIIRDDLHCNAIRLSGTELERLVAAAEIALKLGLEVWFSPQLHNQSADKTLAYIVEAAKAAEKLRRQWPNRVFFIVGCEMTWFMHGIMKGDTFEKRLGSFFNLFSLMVTRRYSKKLNAFLARAAAVSRKEFQGPITYAGALMEKVNWGPFDFIGLDYYRSAQNRQKYGKELSKYTAKYKKPIIVTEVGLCTYQGAENKGALGHGVAKKGENGHVIKPGLVRDEALQARELVDMLDVLNQSGVAGTFVFLFAWPTFPYSDDPAKDLDMASYSIVKTLPSGHGTTYPNMPWEPKQAFSALAKFYKNL